MTENVMTVDAPDTPRRVPAVIDKGATDAAPSPPSIVQAISTARTNGELVAQVARLYAPDPARTTWRVLDPTPGRGGMWTHWRPDNLVATTHDFREEYPPETLIERGAFDLVLFDPPYVAQGGRPTVVALADHLDRYGRVLPADRDSGLTPKEIRSLMVDGMTNLVAYVRPGGMLWVKSADYVTSGRMQWGTHDVRVCGRALGLEQIDELHLRSVSPQPAHARQVHARRGFSTLTIWRKPHQLKADPS